MDLPFIPDVMEDLFIGLCQAGGAKDIQRLVEGQILDADELIRIALNRETEGFTRLAKEFKIDSILLAMLAQDCLKPALMSWVIQYQSDLDLSEWQNPLCPFCGSLPGLEEIQGIKGECHLRCTRCGADWPYRQMACGLCGNGNYHSLGILSIEGEIDKYRVKTCDVCNGYLKAIVTYEPTPASLLAFEDLITLHLDVIAQDRGYCTTPDLELISG
jgi:FdhE protein